jgi:hypothetical protein
MAQVLGQLPKGWSYKAPYLTDEGGYQRHVVEAGRIDRNKIAICLENYGYIDHARRWYLSPVEAAAPEMLEELKDIALALKNGGIKKQSQWLKSIENIIAKAEGR